MGKWHQPFSTGIFSFSKLFFPPEKNRVAQFLLKASWYAQTLLVSSGISDGKLGPSLCNYSRRRADIPPAVHREHIFRALCMGFAPAGLWLTLLCLPRVCGRGWDHLIPPTGSSSVPSPGQVDRQTSLLPAPAHSQAAQSWLLSPRAVPSLETIPFPGPLFRVWPPSSGFSSPLFIRW